MIANEFEKIGGVYLHDDLIFVLLKIDKLEVRNCHIPSLKQYTILYMDGTLSRVRRFIPDNIFKVRIDIIQFILFKFIDYQVLIQFKDGAIQSCLSNSNPIGYDDLYKQIRGRDKISFTAESDSLLFEHYY